MTLSEPDEPSAPQHTHRGAGPDPKPPFPAPTALPVVLAAGVSCGAWVHAQRAKAFAEDSKGLQQQEQIYMQEESSSPDQGCFPG